MGRFCGKREDVDFDEISVICVLTEREDLSEIIKMVAVDWTE